MVSIERGQEGALRSLNRAVLVGVLANLPSLGALPALEIDDCRDALPN
jgi:hypothetical protein